MREILPWISHARLSVIDYAACRRIESSARSHSSPSPSTKSSLLKEWIERIAEIAMPARPHVGDDLYELSDGLDEQDWLRLAKLLGTYSISRLWELRDAGVYYVPPRSSSTR